MTIRGYEDKWREAFAERDEPPLCPGCSRPLPASMELRAQDVGGCWACGRGPVLRLVDAVEAGRLNALVADGFIESWEALPDD